MICLIALNSGTQKSVPGQLKVISQIPQFRDIPGGWTGGTIWINGVWMSLTRDITGHSGSTLTLLDNYAFMKEWYYLTGRLGALDAEREFFYDGSYLYLWQPGGGSPANVEVKKRNFAFDLRGKSNITIKNIKIFAASVMTNPYSENITLDGINAKYINHAVTLTDGALWNGNVIYSHTGQLTNREQSTGIRLMGANSIIKNSHVYFASCMGIVLGENCTAYNNFVHDINYEGNYGSAIAPYNGANGQKILNNTMYRVGRACIDMLNSQNVEIGYNDMYDFGKINNDVGAIYSARGSVLTGTRIHHNWLHDAGNDIDRGWPVGAGIYLDQNSGPVTIDHNVFWNNRMNDLRVEQTTAPFHMIYNNTLASTAETLDIPRMAYNSASFNTYPEHAPTYSLSQNNIYRHAVWHHTPQNSELTRETDPLFVDPSAGGLGFRLQSGSPAIDHGIVIEGITGDYQGSAPDAGAYEYGGEEWVPGAVGYDIQLEFFNSSSDEPVEGMEVIFRGKQYTTNNQGIIQLFNIPDADYKITLRDTTFQLVGNDILEVFSDSVIRLYVRELPRYSVQMTFLDSISGKPVEGLKLSLAGSTHVSDNQGMILIPELLEGNHFLAFPDNRFHITGNPFIEIRSDTTISILVTKVPWLTFQVINRSSGASVYRAAVTVNDKPYYSNSSGFIKVGEFPSGPFQVSVSHKDYFPLSDTLLFSGDTTMILSLTPIRAKVTFSFSDINGPLSGVKVTLSGSPQYTNSVGNAFFFSQPARENYTWSAEKAGYTTLQDSFHLETDTTLQITMDLATMVQKKTGDTHFLVYPNPAHDYLVIDRKFPQHSR
jgi:hypothetical protein